MGSSTRTLAFLTPAKFVLELFDATFGIDKALLASVSGMRMGCHVSDKYLILHAVNRLGFTGLLRRDGEESFTG